MKPKERVLAVLNREKMDRIPVEIWYTEEVLESLKDHTGFNSEMEIYSALGVDKILWAEISYEGEIRTPEGPDETTDHWGCRRKTVQAGAAHYDEFLDYPLGKYDSVESLDDYPWWPDVDRYNYEKMCAHVLKHGNEYATLGPWISFFEVYCWMRGLENAMMDLVLNPDLANAALDRIEAHQTEMVRRFLKECPAKVDMALVSDDMGGQKSLLMSIDCWKSFIGPRLKRWCDLFHSHDVKVFYHSDGSIDALIPHLIEAGIDVLNPIQHVCPGMDRAPLKEKYGNQIVFHGAVDNQSVLPFGTPEDVRSETLKCLEILGGQGGYICCSCHNIQAGTPVENVLALIETVQQEGHRWL